MRNGELITIVSGLPRSGTSMMMKMLEAGGLPILTDDVRSPDEDNPRGYYEYEPVKHLDRDSSWMEEARGKAVKVVSQLLKYLPRTHVTEQRRLLLFKKRITRPYGYRVIFMRRPISEILASQTHMLNRMGETGANLSEDQLGESFNRHLQQVERWLLGQPHMQTLYLSYHEVLNKPLPHAEKLSLFLNYPLDLTAMARIVDLSLYRQRSSS